MGDPHQDDRESEEAPLPPPTSLSARAVLRRSLAAAACVAVLAALVVGLLWSARGSLYRGSLSALAPGVEVTRGGTTAAVKTLQIIELRAGDIVRVSSNGGARLSWAAGGTADLRGGAAVAIGDGPRGLRLDDGQVVIRSEGALFEVERRGRKYSVRGTQIVASPEGIEAARGDIEVLTPEGSRLTLRQGETRSWP